METPLPNPDKLKTLKVDESRAKRLERQHARMRDRGGIFRPENNNNLFDLLRTATHRKSPAKGKGRSRSRSVSPLKKAATSTSPQKPIAKKKQPARRSISRKSVTNAALAPVSEVAEDEIESQDKKPKGKQKVDEAQDVTEQPKPKAKTKKPAPAKKTITAKNSRRTAKQSTPAVEAEGDGTNNKTKQTKPRPRGRRKKQDVDDIEPTNPKSPHCPTVADNDISGPSPTNDTVPEKPAAKSRTKKPASKAQRPLTDQPAIAEAPKEPIDKSSKLPPKPVSKKRKVENIETDDEPRPQKALKPHSKSQPSKTSNSECKARLDEFSEADLACKALEEVPANKPCNVSKKPKRPAQPKPDEPVNIVEGSDACVEKLGSKPTSKTATKRSRLPTENDGELTLVNIVESSDACVEKLGSKPALKTTTKRSRLPTEDDGEPAAKVKKTKIAPLTDVVESRVAVHQEKDSSRSKSTEKLDKTARRPKVVPSKRKENAPVAGKKKSRGGRSGPKAKKQGSGLPAHIRQKLNAQRHETHTLDDDPDPIDFLS